MRNTRWCGTMRRRTVGIAAAVALAVTTVLVGCSSDSADAGGDAGSAASASMAGSGDAGSGASHAGNPGPGAGQAGSAGSGADQAGDSGSDAGLAPADGADQPDNACDALTGVNMGLLAIIVNPDLTEADVAAIFEPVEPFLSEIPEEIQQPLATLRSLGMEVAGGSTVAEVIEDGTEWGPAQAAFTQQYMTYCIGQVGSAG